MGLIWTIVVGFLAGVVAKFLFPGKESMGFLMTTVLGIVGALVASFLGKMVGWGDFARHVRGLAEANGLKTVAFVGRGLTASMIYELRDSGLDIRSYVEDRTRPGDHFEMTRPWSPADPGPILLVFAYEGPPPAALAGRASLVETFTTSIFVTRNSGWKASAYRIDP